MQEQYDIEEIKKGDSDAFYLLFKALYPKMMALACRFVNEYAAKDLVQEAFISFWEKKQEIEIRSIQSFLYKSVQNNCLNHIKHQHVVEEYENRVRIAEARIQFLRETSNDSDILTLIEQKNLREIIEVSLNKLPPKCRQAFKLCYFYDLSHKEVAKEMNISHRTAEVHIQKALAFLREEFQTLLLLLFICSSLEPIKIL